MLPVLVGLLIGGVIIVANWDKIVGWLSDFIPKLKAAWDSVREYVPHGARIMGDVISKATDRLCRIMHKLYYKEDDQWVEETTTRKIPPSEVPPAILAKIKQQEADITEEIEEELQLEV